MLSLTLISSPSLFRDLLPHAHSSPSRLVLCSTRWFLYWILNNNTCGFMSCSTGHGESLPKLLSHMLQVNRIIFCHLFYLLLPITEMSRFRAVPEELLSVSNALLITSESFFPSFVSLPVSLDRLPGHRMGQYCFLHLSWAAES